MMEKILIILLIALLGIIAIGITFIVADTIKFNRFLRKSLEEVKKETQDETNNKSLWTKTSVTSGY